jgi:hypothetical protein
MMWLKNRGAAFETRAIALEDTQTYTALRSIYRSHIKASLLNLASGIARAALERYQKCLCRIAPTHCGLGVTWEVTFFITSGQQIYHRITIPQRDTTPQHLGKAYSLVYPKCAHG